MPRPVYIICSTGGSIDAQSNLVSIFDAIENIQITIHVKQEPHEPEPVFRLPLRATAVWMAQDGDSGDQEWEFETVVYPGQNGPEKVVHNGKFHFGDAWKLFRIVSAGTVAFKKPGLARIESRIRRVGDVEWVSQDYPFTIQVIDESDSKSSESSRP